MAIKSDLWIRRMVEKYRMIEPFEPRQISEINGGRAISYGTSSYGYDVRCAAEFKVFTNINSTIVDPKNFDPASFVDVKSDVCIIPPNSFALARTVEYFRIPRNVLVICTGKSTYARCFRGDTRVALVDGASVSLEEMARRAEEGELFRGYSIGENGRLMVTSLEAPRYLGRDSLVEVTLDNGQRIACTPDHRLMLRDGRWCAAGELTPGASLMPFYRCLQRGYEMVYQPLNGYLYPTWRLADEWNARHGICPDPAGTHRHQAVHKALDKTGSNRSAARYLNDDRSVFRHFPEVLHKFRGVASPLNHKVVSIRQLPGDHDVFCLTVPETGNFALEAGIFVHNCGIIVNVTPLEPEWEGHVTLEFSNTTPLPAKIYANEGVAQVLFLEADEVCETSYRDRGGKYQGQTGVTLPKA